MCVALSIFLKKITYFCSQLPDITYNYYTTDILSVLTFQTPSVISGQTHEAVSYISSKRATAKYFHEAVRLHYGIENKLHWCKDVIFGKDKSKNKGKTALKTFHL